MAFTNMALVRKHILEYQVGTETVENSPFQLTGADWIQLPHISILTGSEKVKAKEQFSPTREEVNLNPDAWINLLHSELIFDSVVLASDSSLGKIYVENLDYSIDYEEGRVKSIATGDIPDNTKVVVWYLHYRIYQKDSDYKIDYSNGKIKRIPSGGIEDGQWILVDYKVEYGFLSDEIISNSILEANAQVLKFIDSVYHSSTEQSLVTAETYLAVSILCGIKAVEGTDSKKSGSFAKASFSTWENLSNSYRKKAYLILSDYTKRYFHKPVAIKSNK
jgi:hypothetical protein